MPITVEEIKKLLPNVNIFSLDTSATHIIAYNKRSINRGMAVAMMEYLNNHGINGCLVPFDGFDETTKNPLQIFEVK